MFTFIVLANILVLGSDPAELHHFRMDRSGYRDNESCLAAAKTSAEVINQIIAASPQLSGQISYGCERSPTNGV